MLIIVIGIAFFQYYTSDKLALRAAGARVVTREELMQRIWGRRQRYRDRTVDVFVRKLRDKIDRPAPAHTFIHTRHGVGYKLEAQAK